MSVKNIEYIQDEELRRRVELAARFYARYARITFKIKQYDDKEITVQVSQDKNPSGVYADNKRLSEITKDTFTQIFPNHTVHTRPIPFVPCPSDVVDFDWLKEAFRKSGKKGKEVAKELGLTLAEVSRYKSGKEPLSAKSRSMFYYYFKYKGIM